MRHHLTVGCFLTLFLAILMHVPDRRHPPPEPIPGPISLTGSWKTSGGIVYDIRHEGELVRLAHGIWPATGIFTGNTLRVWWRSPGGELLWSGEYRWEDGTMLGHYWSAGGAWVADSMKRWMPEEP